MKIDYLGSNNNNNSNSNNNNRRCQFQENYYKYRKFKHKAVYCYAKPKQNLSNVEDGNSSNNNNIVVNNSIELTQLEENKEWLLCFNRKVNGYKAWILLDSEAFHNFINQDFINKNNLKI